MLSANVVVVAPSVAIGLTILSRLGRGRCRVPQNFEEEFGGALPRPPVRSSATRKIHVFVGDPYERVEGGSTVRRPRPGHRWHSRLRLRRGFGEGFELAEQVGGRGLGEADDPR